MTLNNLIIVADGDRARLLRTAHAGEVDGAVALIEIEIIEPMRSSEQEPREPSAAAAQDARRAFLRQIAKRAAHFAHLHYCNPVIVAATGAVCSPLLAELDSELPHVAVRPFVVDVAGAPLEVLGRELQDRGAFSAARYACHV